MMKNKTISLLLLVTLTTSASLWAAEEFVLRSEETFNPTYQNRFSLMMGVNPSLQKAADISNFNFSYAKKLESYWLDTNVHYTRGLFGKLTKNNATATGLSDAQLADTTSTLLTLGVGVAHETRYAQTLLPFTDIYELMAANLTYNVFNEPTSSKSFTGPGILAKFSVYKRFSDYFSAGTQFTYNLAVVKRAQDVETETSSVRSLTLSYLTVGFDLSFYL